MTRLRSSSSLVSIEGGPGSGYVYKNTSPAFPVVTLMLSIMQGLIAGYSRRGARAVIKMVIKDGLFHADPHPGNVFYLPGNRIAFIDFGMVGRLTEERRGQLIHLLLGLLQRDPTRVVDVLLDWTVDGVADESGLILAIQTFVQ